MKDIFLVKFKEIEVGNGLISWKGFCIVCVIFNVLIIYNLLCLFFEFCSVNYCEMNLGIYRNFRDFIIKIYVK